MEVELSQLLRQKGLWLATAESCTGGAIASRITRIAGSSQIFWGGYVVYDNSAKTGMLGVPTKLLARHGAVSTEVAEALARGAYARLPESFRPRAVTLVTTGIAGPSGGTPQKPVGLCYLGLKIAGREVASRKIQAEVGQDRAQIQRFFEDQALAWALSEVRAV